MTSQPPTPPPAGPSLASPSPASPSRSNPAQDAGEGSLCLEDLPPPDTFRWVIRRKALVVAGVRAGLITLEEACARYRLSAEEFLSWQRLIDRHGPRGLRTTRLQQYRRQG